MRKITIENKEYNIKDSWEEVTISEFNLITQGLSADTNDKIKLVFIISLLTNESESTISDLPAFGFNKLLNAAHFIQESPKIIEIKKEYTLNNIIYKLCPEISTITASQYIDYQNYMKEDPIDPVRLLTLWLIPKDHEYNDGYDMELVYKDLSTLSILDARAIAFFFKRQLQVFIIILTDSLQKNLETMKMSPEQIESLTTQLNNMASCLS